VPYNPIDIANYFVEKALSEGKALTPMQVVKLTYIAHGWMLGLTNTPLLDEPIQAWKFGPVVPTVYYAFKSYGNAPITCVAPSPSSKVDLTFIEPVLQKVRRDYEKYSGSELSTLTHKPGTPWAMTVLPYRGGEFPRYLEIPDERIAEYYRNLNGAGGA